MDVIFAAMVVIFVLTALDAASWPRVEGGSPPPAPGHRAFRRAAPRHHRRRPIRRARPYRKLASPWQRDLSVSRWWWE